MIEPAANSPSAVAGAEMPPPSPSSAKTWFRTPEGRRYGLEIAIIIVVKVALLSVLWFALIKPWPRPAAPPASIVQQFYVPAPGVRHD